jgi:hypothetical protein
MEAVYFEGWRMLSKSTVYVPKDLLELIDKCGKDRMDSSRANTIRFLLHRSFADIGYMSEDSKRALGL